MVKDMQSSVCGSCREGKVVWKKGGYCSEREDM